MSNMLNLLILALEDLKKDGQTEVVISDKNFHFLEQSNSFKTINKTNQNISEPSSNGEDMKKSAPQSSIFPKNPEIILPELDKTGQYNWLKDKVLSCPICKQHIKPAKKIVFGVGNLDADIFFCGEAPGADEEVRGEPFVGRAGQLLTKIILAMGLTREKVYIGNIMNWRPELDSSTGNRPPTQEEMQFCLPYLRAQIAIVRPKVIVALGATAVNGLFGYDSTRRMKDVRGHWLIFEHTPCMVTFHPSYLLRNNNKQTKRIVWEDMLHVMERIGIPVSEKQRNFFL